ncbi:MAG TPA: DUF3152 domain-containing protein [Yinghuangia sp.]|uniref:DUF3152 domain-containing protein n=1 Tax=Yinghuangia sp. YIM S10712 TaxID=3436930 RepID=UPI002C30F347|nr:DUF3152 domain-containing protein [Yinghuangia sp.]
MGRHSGTSDTYSDTYSDTQTGMYADAYGGTPQDTYPGYPDHGLGGYDTPAPAPYYETVGGSGEYATAGHGYAGEAAYAHDYAAPSHPGGHHRPYQDAVYPEPGYQEPVLHDTGGVEQVAYDYAPENPQTPQQPYWDESTAWEAPADPGFGTAGQPRLGGQFEPQPQHAFAYAPEAYTDTYAQPLPQHSFAPEYEEPVFAPEPAAWHDAVHIEPVDEPMAVPQRGRADARSDVLADDIEDDAESGAAPPGYVPRPAPADRSAGGRAASRRASRTTSRKPRRLAAAGGAVVTGAVLAGVVVVQMPDGHSQAQASGDTAPDGTQDRDTEDAASRDSERGQVQAGTPAASGAPGPSTIPIPTPSAPQTTTDRMKVRFSLDPLLSLSGKFDVLPGQSDSPAKSGTTKKTYRIEIEQGLALDGNLFAEAVQQTLNDPRSWAHDGRSFVRTDGSADFVVRLASPGTTHRLCGVVGLDTSQDNVSCDAAGTPYVVINAWRWAEGSPTFGDEMLAYRQMLINHEVGHRLGRNHETEACLPGELAPVMMQQTKSLEADNGLICKPNAWPYPA